MRWTVPTTPDRTPLSELVTVVPVFLAPLFWWLAVRAYRAQRAGSATASAGRARTARRLFRFAILDTVIGALLLAARRYGQAAPLRKVASGEAPTSPFAPLFGFDCGELSAAQLWLTLWPVVVGCGVVGLLWAHAKWRQPERAARWGVVVVPLALGPLVGVLFSHRACGAFGGWSMGVGLLGVLAQGAVMLALGGLIRWFARAELRILVGPAVASQPTAGGGLLMALSSVARVALILAAFWSLCPGLHELRETGIELTLAGEHGLSGRLLVLATAVLVAPIAEELLFRGVLLPGLAQHMKPSFALVASASVFALFHIPSHGIAAVLPGVLGLAFGWARLRTGGLRVPIALHVANNLLVTLLTWAGGSGA